MANNLTIESPAFEKIDKEAGQFTSTAINTLWAALNDTRAVERRDFRQAQERLEPKLKEIAAAASQDNVDTEGASVILFAGGSANNVSGFRAPETGKNRILLLLVTQAGTMTVKQTATSEAANQIQTGTGADVALATNKGMVLVYYSSKWRQVV